MTRLSRLGWLAAVLVFAGCGAAGDGSFFTEGDGGGEAEDSGNGGSESAGGDEGHEGETGDLPEAECDDCGPGGLCATDGEDSFCICGDGYEIGATPTLCVVCSADSVDIDMDIVDVAGPITVNGEVPPASVFDSGELYLTDPTTGDEVFLGDTHAGEFSARVLAGRYDLVYRSDGDPMATLPSNTHAVLQRGVVLGGEMGSTLLPVIDVPSRAVTVELSVDGAATPDVEVDDAVLRLVSDDGEDVVTLGRTSGDPSSRVIPGRYSVVYSADTVGASMPADTWRVLPGEHDVDPPGEEQTTALIQVSIETELYDPQVRLNGGDFPQVESDDGVLWLVDSENRVPLGRTSTDRQPVRVIAGGTFTLYYSSESAGPSTPVNRWAPIATGVGPDSQVMVQSYWVQPDLRVDGNTPPDTEVDDASLWLFDRMSGDEAPLGVTSGSVGANVIAGTYDLEYRAQTVGALMPANTRAILTLAEVTSDWSEQVEASTILLDGDITIDGLEPPDVQFASARITLERGEDTVFLGKTSSGAFARRILAGEYDVYYSVDLPGGALPSNEHAPLAQGVTLVADQSLPVDIPLRELEGAVTLEQGSVPSSPADTGRLYLQAAGVGDSASIGDIGAPSYSISVVPGSYAVYYRSDASTGLTPANTNGRVGCFTVE